MDLVDKNAQRADSLINALRLSSCEERARKRKPMGNLFTALGAVDGSKAPTSYLDCQKEYMELLRVCSFLLDMGHEDKALAVHRAARKQYGEQGV